VAGTGDREKRLLVWISDGGRAAAYLRNVGPSRSTVGTSGSRRDGGETGTVALTAYPLHYCPTI
jgi:hypothetical protein